MSRFEGGYNYANYNRPMRHMVEDKEASKEAAYQELEEMANEMLKFMDANDITIFELEINSPQRKKSWSIKASGKDICGRYKWDDSMVPPAKEGKDE